VIVLKVAAATHRGWVRNENQDRLVAGSWILGPDAPSPVELVCLPNPQLVAVLDGMGGHVSGGTASTLAAEVLSASPAVTSTDDLAALAAKANEAVYRRMTDQPTLNGMGSTIVGLCVLQDELAVFNIGDSRAYQLTDGYLIQLSEDDAAPNGLLTASLGGRSSYEEVSLHVARVAVDVSVRILLASDGLFGHVPIEELERQIDPDLLTSVARLMSLALDAGGPDNVTVAMVDAAVVANGEKGGT